jgi:YidC/Oxa1 family membrane protein insertase
MHFASGRSGGSAVSKFSGDNTIVRKKQWVLLLALVVAALTLSGCGVNQDGVDITTTPPDGWWQSLVVWPMGNALIWIDEQLQGFGIPYHWGFAIILFTVIIKIITFPLTVKQIRGFQAQKEIQPKIQELQKKYGKDREKITQEQMRLYKEAGVNPLSGCLPLIVQMPILFGLYAALVAIGPNLQNADFFWIPDLGFPHYAEGLAWITDAFSEGNFGLLIAYLILPILLMISQFIMQKWMTPPTTGGASDGAAGMTKQITYMMTFMFGFFTLTVPAGLTLYWVTSNGLQMLQQWLITSDRFGFSSATPTPVTASGPAASTASTNNISTSVAPATAGVSSTVVDDKADKAKESRRRRAKRR